MKEGNIKNLMNKAKKFIVNFAASLALVFGAGCSGLTNLTPERVPENSSRTYTLTMSAHINDGYVVNDSIEPLIVIDEQIIPMKPVESMSLDRVYEYDYKMPPNRTEAKYYFMLRYKADMGSNGVKEIELKSPVVYVLEPTTRYVVTMQNERGTVGSEIIVLGRGFNEEDKIFIGGKEADVQYVSRSTLKFIVPPLKGGKNYDVDLVGQKGEMWLGQFRVDSSKLEVAPTEVSIESGDFVNMMFNIGFKAPKGGYKIDVKTNIPSSVIMPEVVVPEGRTSVSVPLKGALEGVGKLYINADGFDETVVDVKVAAAKSEGAELTKGAEKIDSSAKQKNK